MQFKTLYRMVLDHFELTQAAGARAFLIDDRTSRRWALGEVEPVPAYRLIMRLLLDGRIGLLELRELMK